MRMRATITAAMSAAMIRTAPTTVILIVASLSFLVANTPIQKAFAEFLTGLLPHGFKHLDCLTSIVAKKKALIAQR